MSLSEIYEGWRNHLIPPRKLREEINRVAKERMSVCNMCKYHSKNFKKIRPDNHCTICGCTLKAKVKCLSCDCPLKYWKLVLSEEQEEEMNVWMEETLKNLKNGRQ